MDYQIDLLPLLDPRRDLHFDERFGSVVKKAKDADFILVHKDNLAAKVKREVNKKLITGRKNG